MKACVFLGPSLRSEQVDRFLPAIEVRPPVRAGDVREALHQGFQLIGIVDGLFEQVATVWHKEILFAMSRGAWVYGGGSMGALRAAELHRYGMVGIGEIFAAYRDGRFEDDDEVAVVHALAEANFRELSTAMANLRFGLWRAAELGIITKDAEAALIAAGKQRCYAERSWKALFHDGKQLDAVSPSELTALEAWVASERPNQKRDDAIALLTRMDVDRTSGLAAFAPDFAFEPTAHWDLAERAFQKKLKLAAAGSARQ